MWIRNQERTELLKIDNISIKQEIKMEKDGTFTKKYGGYIWSYVGEGDFTYLGSYKTEERALEVLDEIQKNIIDNDITQYEYHNSQDGLKTEYTYKLKTVYEMPKE